MLTEVEIIEILNRNRNFFQKCWPKMRFLKFWTEIEFFRKILTEMEISKYWTEIEIFPK